MENRIELENRLCSSIISALNKDIQSSGRASLLVSGGSTPARLFNILSQQIIDWKNITVSLVDDRFLDDNHQDQNGKMVRELLLINHAKEAQFIPLVIDSSDKKNNMLLVKQAFEHIDKQFSAVILGMGGDGHTASLFPDCNELDLGMDLENKEFLIQTNPKAAPYQRISLTRAAILNTKNLFLHFYGEEKIKVFEKASKNSTYLPYPIQGFIQQDKVELQVFKTK